MGRIDTRGERRPRSRSPDRPRERARDRRSRSKSPRNLGKNFIFYNYQVTEFKKYKSWHPKAK